MSSIFLKIILGFLLSLGLFSKDKLKHHTPQPLGIKQDSIPRLQNPMSVAYLKKNLRKKQPRLVLNAQIEKNLRKKIQSDAVVKNVYEAIRLNAAKIPSEALLERKQVGRRLLGVSREMLYRMNMLSMVYRMEKDPAVLERINDEVLAVCSFSDWNPSHYLDVAEMSMAVALALDWTAGDLPTSTINKAKTALIEKGINPSYNTKGNTGWINGTNNWNQVCHGGMIAAAISIADQDPGLASKTIHRALEGMPHALLEYGPDGAYPEGSTYWKYGTSYSVLTASIFESAFGTDFGLGDYPAFKESAMFRLLTNTPSGWYYNFADCGDKRSHKGDLTLSWFAAKTGNSAFLEKERFLMDPEEMGKMDRLGAAGLVYLSQFREGTEARVPKAYKVEGANPIVIFTGGKDDPHQYYFGGKGGRGTVNHGNMDGGSFIFELNGVRWVVDPGNQAYHELEKTGFNLWGKCQECERWTLLTKNNFGHSTITVDDQLHVVDGMASIIDFQEGENPRATIELGPTFEGQLKSAKRTFIKSGAEELTIEDEIEVLPGTKMIQWQLMTTAEVTFHEKGIILKQDGKALAVQLESHPKIDASVISLDPPPLALDRKISNLKRIEFRFPAYSLKEGKEKIVVRLKGA